MVEQIVVSAGRSEYVAHITDEDGERHQVVRGCYNVAFSTPYGYEYTHLHAFPDTDEGQARAERFAARVQAKIDAEGVEALDDNQWSSRVIYGSDAYCDEEPYLVVREREDALLGG